MSFDLAEGEHRRLAAVLAASPDVDPGVLTAEESQAHGMLYDGLDEQQRTTYRMLVEAGASMRDAAADMGRRAWVACPVCVDQHHCPACRHGRHCEWHWRFLLHAEPGRLFVQCPGCEQRWWHDTGSGVGDRPPRLDLPPESDWPRDSAA